eukprot:6823398-Heterocapsa_arctica.AAC.1
MTLSTCCDQGSDPPRMAKNSAASVLLCCTFEMRSAIGIVVGLVRRAARDSLHNADIRTVLGACAA